MGLDTSRICTYTDSRMRQNSVTYASEAGAHMRHTAERIGKRATFNMSRANGSSITEAARSAGVSRSTGQRWATESVATVSLPAEAAGILLTKNDTRAELASIARDGALPAAYRVQAMNLDADLAGTKAPTRSMVATVTVEPSVLEWIDRTYAALPASTPSAPALPAHVGAPTPQLEARASAEPPPRDPQSGEDEGVSTPSRKLYNSEKSAPSDGAK